MEGISDPWEDRVMKDVRPLVRETISSDKVWHKVDGKTVPNVKVLREYFLGEGKLLKADVIKILSRTTSLMKKEPNVCHLKEPCFIIGDTHGQYFDVNHMFEKAIDGRYDLKNTSLLFLGDYVDRGRWGLEIVMFLYSLKLNYPKTIFLLRGNHETAAMTESYTFRDEVLDKYNDDEDLYEAFLESFEALQLAAVVNDDYLCLHGGIGPDLKNVESINKINRFTEPPLYGLLCDIVWSDPASDKNYRDIGFKENNKRDCAYFFGLDPVKKLLAQNKWLSVIRAHDV